MASADGQTSKASQLQRVGAGEANFEKRPRPPLGANSETEVFLARDILHLLGISRRQLQYWAQTNLVEPSITTSGGHHRYTFEDLVALKAVKRLIDAGVSLQRVRSGIRALREALPHCSLPLSELTLVATADVLLVLDEGTDFQALRGSEWIFPVGEFRREVDAWRKLRAPRKVDPGLSPRRSVGSSKRA